MQCRFTLNVLMESHNIVMIVGHIFLFTDSPTRQLRSKGAAPKNSWFFYWKKLVHPGLKKLGPGPAIHSVSVWLLHKIQCWYLLTGTPRPKSPPWSALTNLPPETATRPHSPLCTHFVQITLKYTTLVSSGSVCLKQKLLKSKTKQKLINSKTISF